MGRGGLFVGAERVFNARNLSPERVAATFLAPTGFKGLCEETHAVVVGPRGSGKTTLLKMLTPRALEAWRSPRAKELRTTLPFDAIYVPADVHWEEQLRAVGSGLSRTTSGGELERIFSEAAVTINVLIAVLGSMLDVAAFSDLEEARPAVEFLKVLGKQWQLEDVPPIAGALRESLDARFNELFVLFREIAFGGRSTTALPSWVFLDYLAATRVACTAFENTYPLRGRKKWALCFDELELAPRWLQERLFKELRSTDQRFLLKLSSSPLPAVGDQTWAAPSDDYYVLRLWPHDKRRSRRFSHRLASQMFRASTGSKLKLEDLLGHSTVGAADDSSYEEGGASWSIIRELAEKDKSFRQLLKRRGVNPENPITTDRRIRSELLRKAKPLAHFRVAWLTGHESEGSRRVRTRKRAGLYHGVEDVLDISDGNPRWLITIVRELVLAWEARHQPKSGLTALEQEEVLQATSEQFVGFLRTLPTPKIEGGLGIRLDELVAALGNAFSRAVFDKRFSLNPAGTARAEVGIPDPVANTLRWAAEHGVVVVMDPVERGLDTGVEGLRLRLTYLLAPNFRLPLRAYKAMPLTKCLREGGFSESKLRQLELQL